MGKLTLFSTDHWRTRQLQMDEGATAVRPGPATPQKLGWTRQAARAGEPSTPKPHTVRFHPHGVSAGHRHGCAVGRARTGAGVTDGQATDVTERKAQRSPG